MTDTTKSKEKLITSGLNSAAKKLLDQLPDHAGQLVESLTEQYQMPLWQFLCGILLAVHLEGRLSEFRLDPAWKDGLRTKELVCKYEPCGKKFKPRHVGQPYCSNECGNKATGMWKEPKETKHGLPDVLNDTSLGPVVPGVASGVGSVATAKQA